MEQDRLSGLQVARAAAALSIAYFHSWVSLARFPKDTAYPLPLLTGHGWLAVDMFFAISGFVICLVASKPQFHAPSFLIKRVFRLYPLWLATLTIFSVLAIIWRGRTERETLEYFLYSMTLLPTREFPFYDIGWSLQHEMMFYLAAALIVPFLGLFGLAAFLAISTATYHLMDMPWYLSGLASYHAEFLAGVLAYVARERFARFGAFPLFMIGIGALWFCIAVWGGRTLVPVALFFLILAFVNAKGGAWTKPFVALGDASYSIYLIHPIVFLAASALTSRVTLPLWTQEPIRAACFVVIITASILSWKLYESPMNKLGAKVASLRLPSAWRKTIAQDLAP